MANGFKNFLNWAFGGNQVNAIEQHAAELPSAHGNPLDSFIKGKTGSALTSAQLQQNAWQEHMSNTAYQRGIADMEAAGLNPALMYGSGSPASTPSGSSVSEPSGSFGEVVNAMLLPLQIEQMKANIDATRQETKKKREETETEKIRREQISQNINNLKAELNKLLQDTSLSAAKEEEIRKGLAWLDKREAANIAYVESMANLNDSQRNRINQLLEGEKVLQSKNIEEFEYRWNMFLAQARKDNALAGVSELDIENYGLNQLDSGFMGTGLSFNNLIRAAFGFDKRKNPGKEYSLEESPHYETAKKYYPKE